MNQQTAPRNLAQRTETVLFTYRLMLPEPVRLLILELATTVEQLRADVDHFKENHR